MSNKTERESSESINTEKEIPPEKDSRPQKVIPLDFYQYVKDAAQREMSRTSRPDDGNAGFTDGVLNPKIPPTKPLILSPASAPMPQEEVIRISESTSSKIDFAMTS